MGINLFTVKILQFSIKFIKLICSELSITSANSCIFVPLTFCNAIEIEHGKVV